MADPIEVNAGPEGQVKCTFDGALVDAGATRKE